LQLPQITKHKSKDKKVNRMTYIRNTKYITINKDGVFVGGKPATHYRGVKMGSDSWERESFYVIQARYPNVMEIHVLSSKTCGVYAKAGNPSAETGPNVWCRVKFTSGHIGSWVLRNKFESGNDFCAENCLYVCMAELDLGKDFRNAVFGANLFDALKTSDLSVFVNNPLQINGYEIVVRKLAETQQNKR
jgi:hypothetical protein